MTGSSLRFDKIRTSPGKLCHEKDRLPPLPDRFINESIGESPASGRGVRELASTVKAFYNNMEWNDAGVPTEEKLQKLGIN